MKVVIAGGHGQIARRLGHLLATRGDDVVGIMRNPQHKSALIASGMRPYLCDLERASPSDMRQVLHGADAVVFAAGAGPGSGVARKYTVDYQAAVDFADAALHAGVRRYVMVSTRGAGSPPPAHADEVWAAYVRAKTAADEYLMAQDLDWTILRPAALTNEPGTGAVRLTAERGIGTITRDDVALVLASLLDVSASAGLVLEAAEGVDPIREAVHTAAECRLGGFN